MRELHGGKRDAWQVSGVSQQVGCMDAGGAGHVGGI